MISSYRLGDLVLISLNHEEQNAILSEHPDSIGSRYILNKQPKTIDMFVQIVLQYLRECEAFLPPDISYSIVVHLRLGDVVAGNEWHEKIKRPLKIEHIKSSLQNNADNKYVIGRPFFAVASSKNYEECIELSNKYLKDVLQELGATHYDSGNADIDFCCAVKSKLFVQGQGYFSKLIVEVRKRLNLPSIEL